MSVLRRWVVGVTASVAVCASSCAAATSAAPPTLSSTTGSISAGAPDRASFTAIHWVATQVQQNGVSHSIPAAMAVAVDFLQSGSVIFTDGVNAISARWVPLSTESVRLDEVASTGAGYAGNDSTQLAAIAAVQQLTFPSSGTDDPSASEVTVTRSGDVLTLAGTQVRIAYRNAGISAPELTRSDPATTGLSAGSSPSAPAATSAVAGDPGAATPYNLLTHCGIREALIDGQYYLASPVLDDGNGNPPKGWRNPYDGGTMTVNRDRTADFRDTAGNRAHFVLRRGATTRLEACA